MSPGFSPNPGLFGEATFPSDTEWEEPPADRAEDAQTLEIPRSGSCVTGGKAARGSSCRFKLENLEQRPVQVILQSQGMLNLSVSSSSGESVQTVPTELPHPVPALGIACAYEFSPQPNLAYYLSVSGQDRDFVLIVGYSSAPVSTDPLAAALTGISVESPSIAGEEEGANDFWLYAFAILIALLLVALGICSLFFLKSSRPRYVIRFQCLNGPRLKVLVNMNRLKREPITFGRSDKCRVALPDKMVSSRHGAFINDGGRLSLVDYESTNGTFVNKKRILYRTPIPVSAKDDIVVGSVHISISPYARH